MRIPVFYRPEMSVADNDSYSPSAGKPRLVVEDWLSRRGVITPYLDIVGFEPATLEMLTTAHSRDYVKGVLSGEIENGFGNNSPAVAESLHYTVGSMVAACMHVLGKQHGIAVSPTSGFHHAHYDRGEGFCTFNGLMVAALWLKARGLLERVLILDFDQHYGNGTDDIVKVKRAGDWLTHITANKSYRTASDVERCTNPVRLSGLGPKPDLVMFQAGADIHVNDPLGGILTTKQMRARDYAVFDFASWYEVPLVWNLAGGYQQDAQGTIEPVLALHRATMTECINCYRREP